MTDSRILGVTMTMSCDIVTHSHGFLVQILGGTNDVTCINAQSYHMAPSEASDFHDLQVQENVWWCSAKIRQLVTFSSYLSLIT